MVIEVVEPPEVRPVPVHAANELPPAEDLAHEAFDARNRQALFAPCTHCRVDHFARIEQLQVETRGQERVPEERFVAPEGVLKRTERGQSRVDEPPERIERLALLVPAGIVNGKVLEGIFKLGIPMARFRRSPTATNRERFLGNLLTTTDDDWNDYLADAFQSYRMNMSVPPLAKPAEFQALRAPVMVIAAADDYSFPGDRLLLRAKVLFPTLSHSELLPGAKHSPPTTDEFREWLGGKLGAFFAGA